MNNNIIAKMQTIGFDRENDKITRSMYLKYYFRDIAGKKISIAKEKLDRGVSLLSCEKGNDFLGNAISGDVPFAGVRPGMVETDELFFYDERTLWPANGLMGRRKERNGAFRSDEEWKKYEETVRQNLSETDAIFAFRSYKYKYLRDIYISGAPMFTADALCPIGREDAWTFELKGKKVLVVSAFDEYIQKQFARIDKVFPVGNPWPDMELLTVKSVWFASYESRDQRFDSYFDALQYLYDECMKQDFDVALLCCSWFGLDLAPMLKRAGKKAIQMGGDMQMMFGIRGKRWDNNSFFSPYFNDYWIRPGPKDMGVSGEVVQRMDGGCYW